MRTMFRLSLFLLLFFIMPLLSQAEARPRQDLEAIRNTALAYARAETATLPGEITIQAEELDTRLNFARCQSALEAFLPAGSVLRGKTAIGVRCKDAPGWTVFVPLLIRIVQPIVISSRPLPQGKALEPGDLALQVGEVTHPGLFHATEQVLGKVLKYPLAAGQAIKQEMLREPWVITAGQQVTLEAAGNGFIIRSAGVAQNNAAEGQPVKVKTGSGQVVSGIARPDGKVEVR